MIAIIPTAMVAMMATNLLGPTNQLTPTARLVSLDIIPTAAIVEASNTIGFADSDIYGLSKPDGTLDEAAVLKSLDAMQALGVNDVRVLIPWAFIQPVDPAVPAPFNPGPDWSRADFIINAANARGMGVLGVLNATPYYGINPEDGGYGYSASPDPAQYAAFTSEAAARYAGKVSAYEVWNEPNSLYGWTPTPDASAYTAILKAAYTAIKAADPNALVVGGVLVAGVYTFPGLTVDPVDYVTQMYADGAKGYFDALSVHPYQYTTKYSLGGYDPNGPISQVIDIRQLMIDNGDAALRIWASEYGLPTSGPNGVTEQNQADFIKDFLETWAATSYAGPAFIYTTRDQPGYENTDNGSFGVYTSDWQEKLAAKVIKAILNPGVPPTNPTDPGQAIADALNAIFQQLATAYAQAFASAAQAAVTAYVNAIAQAINDALSAAFSNLAVPATQQASIVEGVSAARANIVNLKVDTEASVDTSSADVEKATGDDTKTLATVDGATVAGSEVVDAVAPTTTATLTEPVTPITPTTPATPAESVTPATPVTPVTPTEPVTPVTPTEPVAPVTPVTPTKPVTPTESATPATPTEPVTPTKPVTPTEPVTPTKPVTTSQPSDGPTQAGSTPPADKPKTPKEKEKAADSSSTDTHSRPARKPRTRDGSESGDDSTANATPDKHTKVTGGPGSAPASSPSGTSGEAASAPSAATAGATA